MEQQTQIHLYIPGMIGRKGPFEHLKLHSMSKGLFTDIENTFNTINSIMTNKLYFKTTIENYRSYKSIGGEIMEYTIGGKNRLYRTIYISTEHFIYELYTTSTNTAIFEPNRYKYIYMIKRVYGIPESIYNKLKLMSDNTFDTLNPGLINKLIKQDKLVLVYEEKEKEKESLDKKDLKEYNDSRIIRNGSIYIKEQTIDLLKRLKAGDTRIPHMLFSMKVRDTTFLTIQTEEYRIIERIIFRLGKYIMELQYKNTMENMYQQYRLRNLYKIREAEADFDNRTTVLDLAGQPNVKEAGKVELIEDIEFAELKELDKIYEIRN
jgi:hypothetical protein